MSKFQSKFKAHTTRTLYSVTIALAILLSIVGPTLAQTPVKPKPTLKKPKSVKPAKPKLVPQKTLKPGELLPFFDNVDNPELLSFPRGKAIDASPKPPTITVFDRAVLNTCGAFGSSVSTEQVRSLFEKNPEVLAQIKEAVEGNVLPRKSFRGKRLPSPRFFDEFIEVWTGQQAFEHVFCGQVKGNRLTGLHFAPRYYELQQKGIAGRLPKNERQEEVVSGQMYTVGIQAKINGKVLSDPKSGYYYGRDAIDIIIDGTRAHQQFNISSGSNNAVCLYQIPQVPEQLVTASYPSVFVKNDRGIVTLYPDVTPNPGDRACNQPDE